MSACERERERKRRDHFSFQAGPFKLGIKNKEWENNKREET